MAGPLQRTCGNAAIPICLRGGAFRRGLPLLLALLTCLPRARPSDTASPAFLTYIGMIRGRFSRSDPMQAAAQRSSWPAVIRQNCEGRLFGQTCAKMNVLDRARAISAVQPFPPGAVTDDVAELRISSPAWGRWAQFRRVCAAMPGRRAPLRLTAGTGAGCFRNWCWRSKAPGCPVAAASAAPSVASIPRSCRHRRDGRHPCRSYPSGWR